MARATPRSNPNYDVHLSESTIRTIFRRSLPAVKSEHVAIEHIPSGYAYNNRIYFVNLSEPTTFPRPQWRRTGSETTKVDRGEESRSFVLKVVGHPVGPSKTQNEVACLLLLEKYCPAVPAPRLIAWSDDGQRIRKPLDPRGSKARSPSWFLRRLMRASRQNREVENGQMETKGQGWILMTRVPGRVISPDDLTGVHGNAIMTQMAELVAAWRTQMPPAQVIGNLRLMSQNLVAPPSATLYDSAILPGLDVYVDGVILAESTTSTPHNTSLKYFTHRLEAEVRRLKAGNIYGPNREPVSRLVQHFITETMPRLPIFTSGHAAERMIFTHGDLSLRNVLVSSTPSATEVTAVVDFEFAGFYPAAEEFANTLENDHPEWPLHLYEQFLSTLNRLEALPGSLSQSLTSSPPDGSTDIAWGTPEFHQAVLLARIAGNTAPFWVKPDSGQSEEEVTRELTQARERVERAVERLEAMASGEQRS